MRSVFSLTGRDNKFQRPYNGTGLQYTPTSYDADFLNTAQDALTSIEADLQNAITVDPQSARANGLSCAVQRWTFNYTTDGTSNFVYFMFPLSSTFLEDCGVIAQQTQVPTLPNASLASSLSLTFPRFPVQSSNLTNDGGLILNPPPPWATSLTAIPVLSMNVRLIGATGKQTIGISPPVPFDAGNGLSPQLEAVMFLSHPDMYYDILPTGLYEASIVAMNWIP